LGDRKNIQTSTNVLYAWIQLSLEHFRNTCCVLTTVFCVAPSFSSSMISERQPVGIILSGHPDDSVKVLKATAVVASVHA